MILHVGVANKIATFQKRDGCIVCGNSDYQIQFTFDSEWASHTEKTARFIWNGQFIDVDFTGDTCNVPIIQNANEVKVGVYAGDLRTTTSAVISCYTSILCEGATPSVENDKVYANEAKEAAERAEAAAERAENGGGGISITREHYNGSGSVTITVQDQYVYYVEGYSNITVELPDGEFSAYFFVSFPEDALTCSFNLPDGVSTFGNDLAECDFGENWEISIDSVGGALALRKRGL